MSVPPNTPPKWALPLGALFAACAYGSLFVAHWREHAALEATLAQLERQSIEELTAPERSGAELRVVALGHSLLRRATPGAPVVEELARSSFDLDLAWSRITRQGGGFNDWREQIEWVVAARPDLVLIDQRFLTHRAYGPSLLTRHRQRVRHQLARLVVTPRAWAQRRARFLLHRFFDGAPMPAATVERTAAAYRAAVERASSLGLPPLAELARPIPLFPLQEFAQRCQANGIDIAILDVPSLAQGGPNRTALGTGAAAALVTAGAVEHWVCDLALGTDAYLDDLHHISESGRPHYTRWLLTRLAEYAER
ncbi:MAG: hypothetical protein AAF628_07785 [Planctomycetota bacterium]